MDGPFFAWSDLTAHEKISGGVIRVVHGESMSTAIWEFAAGTHLMAHSHPHEQITFVISGVIDLQVGDQVQRIHAGDGAIIPGGVEHQATVIETARIIDCFHPVREDLRG